MNEQRGVFMNNILILVLQVFWVFFVFLIIAFIAYFFTKTFARTSLNIRQTKNIKVVDSLSLGINKHLLIIKIGESYYLFSISDKTLNFIKELEWKIEETDISMEKSGFSAMIESYKDKIDFSKEKEFITKNMEKIKQLLNRSKKL